MALGVIWADGVWNEAIWNNAIWAQASAAPTFIGATIANDGDSISLVFTEPVTIGAGGNAGVVATLSGGANALTYDSGDGTDTLVYTFNSTVQYDETGTIAYTQPGNGIEADDDGADVASFSGVSVVNNSTVGAPARSGVISNIFANTLQSTIDNVLR